MVPALDEGVIVQVDSIVEAFLINCISLIEVGCYNLVCWCLFDAKEYVIFLLILLGVMGVIGGCHVLAQFHEDMTSINASFKVIF